MSEHSPLDIRPLTYDSIRVAWAEEGNLVFGGGALATKFYGFLRPAMRSLATRSLQRLSILIEEGFLTCRFYCTQNQQGSCSPVGEA